MTRFKYPPCSTNWQTEKPYPRHDWEIPEKASVILKKDKHTGQKIYCYRIRCRRCGLNDPKEQIH